MEKIVKQRGRFTLVQSEQGFVWRMADENAEPWYWHPTTQQWTPQPDLCPTPEQAGAGLNPDAPRGARQFHHHENPTGREAASRSLAGKVAADLMTPNPVSIHGSATVPEVVAFLTDTGFSAAPVIDDTGHPIGVVSRTDVLVYDRARLASAEDVPGYYDEADLAAPVPNQVSGGPAPGAGALLRASDLMTPAVYAVTPETPGLDVVAHMVRLNVHRLFVVDRAAVLVGVISALDLLRHLLPEGIP
jgi:CBS domain-containing protein